MNAIKMNRFELLNIVISNCEKHKADYVEAVADYKTLVKDICAFNLKISKTESLEEFKKLKTVPASPVNYEPSYKRAIRMLELSVDEIIEVEEDVFNQLVLDEWDWKRNFVATASLYKSGAF